MELREGEQILRVYHHHPTPFVFDIVKVIGATIPFYIALFAFQNVLSTSLYIIIHLIYLFIFISIVVYVSLIYWLDRLILTNMRIIYIDYKFLTIRDDSVCELKDIQDIQTKEKGLLAYFKVFDYGTLMLDTPSSYVTLVFPQCPNPEGLRQFIYHLKNQ